MFLGVPLPLLDEQECWYTTQFTKKPYALTNIPPSSVVEVLKSQLHAGVIEVMPQLAVLFQSQLANLDG